MRLVTAVAFASHAYAFVYPTYCSKISDNFLEARSIPPISTDLELLQVNVIVRHGARAPSEPYSCWAGYAPRWDCDLLAAIAANDLTRPADDAKLHPKLYDVDPLQNLLHGTCAVGHLLPEGYQQHRLIGEKLAEAYQIGKKKKPLLTRANVVDQIYFRSSDMQRTVLSGSALIDSFLSKAGLQNESSAYSIPVHTMDEAKDTLYPNVNVCPVLTNIRETIFASHSYAHLLDKFKVLTDYLQNVTKRADIQAILPGELFDCIMTTICSEQLDVLPDGLKEGDLYSPLPEGSPVSVLNWTLDATDEMARFEYSWRDGLFSRLAIGKFLVQFKSEVIRAMLANIGKKQSSEEATKTLEDMLPASAMREFYQLITKGAARSSQTAFGAKRFVLYAGHDTTVLPFLSALKGLEHQSVWPPYATEVVLELYATSHGDSYYFRLIHNGQAITNRLIGCDTDNMIGNDLCKLEVFFRITDWAVPSKVVAACEGSGLR